MRNKRACTLLNFFPIPTSPFCSSSPINREGPSDSSTTEYINPWFLAFCNMRTEPFNQNDWWIRILYLEFFLLPSSVTPCYAAPCSLTPASCPRSWRRSMRWPDHRSHLPEWFHIHSNREQICLCLSLSHAHTHLCLLLQWLGSYYLSWFRPFIWLVPWWLFCPCIANWCSDYQLRNS
jgi:hypothetical protein